MVREFWAGKKPRAGVGDRVQLSGAFLRNTGQAVGGEGRKRWTVVACDCALCGRGTHVAVDEEYANAETMFADLPREQWPKRHFAEPNLKICGQISGRDAG